MQLKAALFEDVNKIYPTFYTFHPTWIKFGTEVLHAIPRSICKFRENRCSEWHSLPTDGKEMFAYFLRFRPIWIKPFIWHVNKNAVHNHEFSGTLGVVKALLYYGHYVNIYPYFPRVLSSVRLCEIRYKSFAQNTVQHLWVSCKLATELFFWPQIILYLRVFHEHLWYFDSKKNAL